MYRLSHGIALVALAVLALSYVANFTSNTVQFAYACSCAGNQTPEDALTGSTAVFSGRVIGIKDNTMSGGYGYSAFFDLDESWKGIEDDPVIITTAISSASCGYDFEKDMEYLVYAYAVESNLHTNSCSRTNLISNAQADLLVLGEGKNWTNVHPVTEFESTESYDFVVVPLYWLIGIPLAIIGAIVGGIIGFRRWKRKKE